ncbi:putative RNA-directed DNA polymerase like protein [Argiope bruennichi]|uniref:Putative RNA-directed DNA polymerase like protein n=1 Tax=Argiope bruennichi TaxID=94029 RepID=A0A8T0ESD9_ARGBR|nr:putative RNA-directed DNA polymerase like protein [Argiope bruennichi]
MLRHIEATMVIAQLPNLPPINFVSVYNPPNSNTAFTLDFELIYAYNTALFMAGDFNAKNKKWNCARTCRLGTQLDKFAGKTNARIIAPEEPTHYQNRSAYVIDIAIARNISQIITAETLNELSSDHMPVRFHIATETLCEDNKIFIPNWGKYKLQLLLNSDKKFVPKGPEEIEEEINRFTNEILTAYKESGRYKEKYKHETTQIIKEQIKNRNRLRKIWQRTRHPNDKRNLNRAQNYLNKLQYDQEQKRWENYIANLDPVEGSLWKLVKKIKNNKFRIPPLKTEHTIVYSNKEKAEAIADSLAKQFKNNNLSHPPTEYRVKQKLEKFEKTKNRTEDKRPSSLGASKNPHIIGIGIHVPSRPSYWQSQINSHPIPHTTTLPAICVFDSLLPRMHLCHSPTLQPFQDDLADRRKPPIGFYFEESSKGYHYMVAGSPVDFDENHFEIPTDTIEEMTDDFANNYYSSVPKEFNRLNST